MLHRYQYRVSDWVGGSGFGFRLRIVLIIGDRIVEILGDGWMRRRWDLQKRIAKMRRAGIGGFLLLNYTYYACYHRLPRYKKAQFHSLEQ